ncbi:MAG: type III pantothenate kinase [Candidatus Cloacimonetes bacterium]|jgi:type III pantothenate kinase|nr:type III pantothenate kinase [Candidatus Cloacimonadota bacterium]MDD4099954.1 type III pantothenate kinase [Candidatus Cloacimonadota bacterium]MDD4806131.1 type III pantothenate kinase [Candidatus Cloacimonadota bacterium]
MPFSAEKSHVLIVDIGNTNIVCAVFECGEAKDAFRLETDPDCSVESLHQQFLTALPRYCSIPFVALGSVVPLMTGVLKQMFARYSPARLYEINGLSPLGLGYVIENPAVVGADLVANAFAAWQLYQGSSLVVDLGTATTIQLINASGLYAGVVIAPGMKTAAAHLFEKAAQLSEVNLEAPGSILGNNTHDAMLSGIVRGHALMIHAFIDQISEGYAQWAPYRVILTGGLAGVIQPLMPDDYIYDAQLTLKGFYLALMRLIEQENNAS